MGLNVKLWLSALIVGLNVLAQTSFAVEVAPDGKVTFRIPAADAKKVELQGQWAKGRIAFEKGKDEWSVTIDAVPAGVWEYNFVIDGIAVIDSSNPLLKPQRKPSRSILHIPGTPPNPWDWRDVPHGTVHQHAYQSKVLGRRRDAVVYTPPGYEKSGDTKYPLLVLQHGSGDQHDTWVDHGKAHWILDNLIADGKAVPMIVLMIDGHPMGQVSQEAALSDREAALTAFERELLEDALPLVESHYRVEAGSDKRALAGLSMGGAQTLGVGLPHADRFAWLGCFSGAMPPGDRMQQALHKDKLNAQFKLFWIACGEKDFLLKQNHELIATLKEKGIQHEWHETPGDHSWPIWRGYLSEFAPRLFR
jgi:enterochelin esterase-like enzyme